LRKHLLSYNDVIEKAISSIREKVEVSGSARK
jgi:hypothetical protein